jgi:hypothetical protein
VTQTLPRVRFPKFPYEVKMAVVSVLIAPGALFGGWEIGRVTDHRIDAGTSTIVVTETVAAVPTTSMTPTPKAGEREVGVRPVRGGSAVATRTLRTTPPAPTTASVPTKAPSETSSVRTTSASPTSVPEVETGPVSPVCHDRCTSESPEVPGVGDSQLGDPAGG